MLILSETFTWMCFYWWYEDIFEVLVVRMKFLSIGLFSFSYEMFCSHSSIKRCQGLHLKRLTHRTRHKFSPLLWTFASLMFQIRQHDRLAVTKLVTSLTKGSVRSPLAQCLLIRYASQVKYYFQSLEIYCFF